MLGSILVVVLGALLAVVVILAVEVVGRLVYPPPPGTDLSDPASLAAAMRGMPAGAFLFLLGAWALGTLAGAWLAATLARRARAAHALIVGALMLAAGIANLLMIPHPVWVAALGVALFLPSAYLGALIAGPRQAR